MDLIGLFKEGGFIMYPLLICSLCIWAVIIEKFWGIKQFTTQHNDLFSKAQALLKDKKVQEAKGLYLNAHKLISAPILVLFDEEKMDRELRQEKIARRLQETQIGLKKFLWILGTVGSMAPFIGLFGTVLGIIRSFEDMARTGQGGFSVVAAGLSEALIATAAGILVAVVAVIFYNYFQNRLGRINVEYKNKIEDLSDLFETH